MTGGELPAACAARLATAALRSATDIARPAPLLAAFRRAIRPIASLMVEATVGRAGSRGGAAAPTSAASLAALRGLANAETGRCDGPRRLIGCTRAPASTANVLANASVSSLPKADASLSLSLSPPRSAAAPAASAAERCSALESFLAAASKPASAGGASLMGSTSSPGRRLSLAASATSFLYAAARARAASPSKSVKCARCADAGRDARSCSERTPEPAPPAAPLRGASRAQLSPSEGSDDSAVGGAGRVQSASDGPEACTGAGGL